MIHSPACLRIYTRFPRHSTVANPLSTLISRARSSLSSPTACCLPTVQKSNFHMHRRLRRSRLDAPAHARTRLEQLQLATATTGLDVSQRVIYVDRCARFKLKPLGFAVAPDEFTADSSARYKINADS